MNFPKIKKRMKNFLIDETGRISKQKIVNGLIIVTSFNLSTNVYAEVPCPCVNVNEFYTDGSYGYGEEVSKDDFDSSNDCSDNFSQLIIKEGHHNITQCDCDGVDSCTPTTCSCLTTCSCNTCGCTSYSSCSCTSYEYCSCDGYSCSCQSTCSCTSACTCKSQCTCQGVCSCDNICSCNED